MPGIKRARSDYSSVAVVDVTEPEVKPAARFCIRCREMFGIYAVLGSRVLPLDKTTSKPIPKPHDYSEFLECHNCGSVYAKYEIKQEPELSPVKEPDATPFDFGNVIIEPVRKTRKYDKTGRSQAKRKRKQELDNIKDEALKRELKNGSELISYEETKIS